MLLAAEPTVWPVHSEGIFHLSKRLNGWKPGNSSLLEEDGPAEEEQSGVRRGEAEGAGLPLRFARPCAGPLACSGTSLAGGGWVRMGPVSWALRTALRQRRQPGPVAEPSAAGVWPATCEPRCEWTEWDPEG